MVALGWTDQELLMVVQDNGMLVVKIVLYLSCVMANGYLYGAGTMTLYNIHGTQTALFSVFGDSTPSNIRVSEAHCWENGCVVMGSDLQLYTVEVIL